MMSIEKLSLDVQSLMKQALMQEKRLMHLIQNFMLVLLLLLDNDEIVIIGSNQENASYPSGLCAERTAIYYAGAKYPKAKIVRMAISAASQNQMSQAYTNSSMWSL